MVVVDTLLNFEEVIVLLAILPLVTAKFVISLVFIALSERCLFTIALVAIFCSVTALTSNFAVVTAESFRVNNPRDPPDPLSSVIPPAPDVVAKRALISAESVVSQNRFARELIAPTREVVTEVVNTVRSPISESIAFIAATKLDAESDRLVISPT